MMVLQKVIRKVNDNVKHVEPVKYAKKHGRYANASKFPGPNLVWVPKKT